jgi:hypothetical protein
VLQARNLLLERHQLESILRNQFRP